MSEYQYYEFQTIDQPLSAEQQAEMRKLSSRVELSASRAAFNYSYGDLRGQTRRGDRALRGLARAPATP